MHMDGWMDGLMDGWMDGLMDGWIDEEIGIICTTHISYWTSFMVQNSTEKLTNSGEWSM